jgi:biotin synthase
VHPSKITENFPKRVRVSLGSAVVLGLLKGKLETEPTTAYFMTYKQGKCAANCGFCPQARQSLGRADMLSRVSWPIFQTEKALKGLETAVGNGKIRRVCIQALNYTKVFTDLSALVKAISQRIKVPISVSCQPPNRKSISLLAEANAERIGIPLDAATQGLFDKVKGKSAGGPYEWEKQFELLSEAVDIFGCGKVSTHLIVGLGETEKESIKILQRCTDMNVMPALFAFTPIPGTRLEENHQPSIEAYRRIQLARYLILHKLTRFESMRFDSKGRVKDFGVDKQELMQAIQTSKAFRTSGCSDCNRPYYNEKPSGPIYNFPRELTKKELYEVREQLGMNEA